ncbi:MULTISPECIES: branched-chain amino acid ABC transporter permease [unclassified Pseudonocardia]|uniref:branched-chain amino acid ABC transporter permease n=1 Tax=unclassified Pseudonocardia TaxID=2619320 RepID=UPI0001FFE801|nr:branched-chain amino acid ABC transporter permease [Pseudonocardia sp. Ae707_Ps1]OLM18122.1 High-affinity branched-chain amino acid transport system permease protein LivH [Pseudonocardia sp. Ae707_Ps1]
MIALIGTITLSGTALAAAAPAPAPAAAPAAALPAQSQDGIDVSGTLRDQNGQPLTGVTIVAARDGAPVAQATSQANGRWELTVPAAGSYTFRLDEATLPPGTQVLQGETTREVAEGSLNTVVFRFGEEVQGAATGGFATFLRLLVDGIRFGLVIGISAIGLSLIFGTTGLTNFAHGEMVTIGAVVAWYINVVGGVQLIPATIIAVLVGAALGAANELGIWRRLRRRGAGLIAQLVVSIGLSIALRYLILIFFGGRSESFTDYTAQQVRNYGPIALTDKDLSAIVIAVVVLLGVALLLQRTRIGKAMRAVSDNRDLAASSGINVDRVILFVWMLGGGLATLGGVLFALSELSSTVQYEMGFRLLLLMFAGVILGGLGTAYGALLGCLIVGILVQLSTLVLPLDLKYLGGLAVLIVILVFRPQGLLGSKARIG